MSQLTQCLDEDVFLSKSLSIGLLLLHIGILTLFALKWLKHAQYQTDRKIFFTQKKLSPVYVIYTMFVSNFVGIVFARTLHYQFYCWYFHAIPFMIWKSVKSLKMRILMGVCITGGLEYSFNVFPATPLSSIVLQISHLLLLMFVIFASLPSILEVNENTKQDYGKTHETLRHTKKE